MNPESRPVRLALRGVLVLSLACLLAYIIKDARLLLAGAQGGLDRDSRAFLGSGLIALRVSPLYLIPLIMLLYHLRTAWSTPWSPKGQRSSLFLLPSLGARVTVTCVVVLAMLTGASALHRRSDVAVRALVGQHRE